MQEYIHLHNHTHYSLLDAACTPDQLVLAAAKDGQKALALTDHGVMFGAIEFYNKAKKAGIKPILGFEAYIANGSRFDKTAGKAATKKKNYFHMVLLAKNRIGYANLLKLTSFAHTEGFYYKPRIDRGLIEQYHEGIIALSGCIAGVVSAPIINNDDFIARDNVQFYKDIFGEDFYLELQNHGLPEDEMVLNRTPVLAKEYGVKLVATNDVHYEKKEHAIAHNVLLLIKDSSKADTDKINIYDLQYRSPEMYFKSQEQMNDLFKDFPEAIESTVEIADKCEFELCQKFFMPEFPVPEQSQAKNLEEYLYELTEIGVKEHFKEITEEIRNRIDFELEVINKMGFAGYFLIVQDLILTAKKLGVSVGPGRGSVAGSLVAYCLGITNINPLPYDLLFERFLNPDRISMPDIDIDFSDETRERVINYAKEKYGENSVAQIVTFGKLSSRAVLKDVGRVLGIPLTVINQITSKIPVIQGKVTPISEALETADLRYLKDIEDPKMKELMEYSQLLEGFYRNTSIHAAGVVIAPGNVSDYVPLYQSPNSKSQGAEFVTQYPMNDLEQAGLLKMDFLGLRTLSIIDHTLEMIEQNHGIKINLDEIDFEDEESYELISNGNTLAVFQFESKGMQDYLRQLKPHNLEEITAMNALYRPGPMQNIPDYIDCKLGRKSIEYIHPIMESSLKNTYGVIVYQEQVMQLARDTAGFSLAQADNLRRAMGKKKQSVMDEMQPQFLSGAKERGIDQKDALEIWALILKFAKYGFNKSHSLAYSYLAFQTAWLKTHYPAEFLAANMSAELNNLDKIVELIEEAQKFGINVLPPDVNRSYATFTAIGSTILFGLAGIKNVGVHAVESIIKAREEKPFTSFFDFVARVDNKLLNKRALEALVCAGAFDSFADGHRAAFFLVIEPAIEYARHYNDSFNNNVVNLFGGASASTLTEPVVPKVQEWTEKERLEREKEVLNFYISGNPLHRHQLYISSLSNFSLNDKETASSGGIVRVCGIISEIRTRLDKRQNTIAFVTIEDLTGKAECIFWSDAYSKYNYMLKKDEVLLFTGKTDLDNETVKIIVDQVMTLGAAAEYFAKGLNLWINIEKSNELFDSKSEMKIFSKFQDLCSSPKVKNTIIFNLFDNSNKFKKRYVAYDVNIQLNESTLSQVIELFGAQNVKLLLQ
jgi:DNA polymerase III subunit alpha